MSFYLFLSILIFNNFFGWILCNNNDDYYNSKDLLVKDRSYLSTQPLSAPKILYDNTFSIKLRDDTFHLNCNATGTPNPIIKWFILNPNINRYSEFSQINKSEIYTINSAGSLIFSNTPAKLSANYFCSASNIFGTVFSRKSEVPRIFIPKDLRVGQETTDIIPNEKAVFECIIDPSILTNDFTVKEWQIRINDDQPFSITKTGGRFSVINVTKVPQLHVRNVTKDDFSNMQVKCVLVNRFAANLIVDSANWIRPKEYIYEIYGSNLVYYKCKGSEIYVIQGSTVELPWCSNPATTVVTWYKSKNLADLIGDRVPIDGHKFSLVSERYGNLLINNVDISDEGYYFVKKINSLKMLRDYKPFQLRVSVTITINIVPIDILVPFGARVSLQCVVTGYPVSDIFWLHNGIIDSKPPVVVSIDTRTYVTNLTIDNVTEHSVGVYQCVAESRSTVDNKLLDSGQLATSVIINEMQPRLVSQVPAVSYNNPYATALLTRSSNDFKVQCSFNATPKASIEWYIDDKPISIDLVTYIVLSEVGLFTIVSNLHINVEMLSDTNDLWKYGGLLVAKATNNYGTAQCKTLVFVEGVLKIRDPGDITLKHGQKWSLKCDVISSKVPEITWSKIKNGEKTKFPETHLEYESADRREIRIKSVDKTLHEASYECNVMVDGKKVSRTIKVIVAMPPTGILPFPEEAYLQDRNIIENHCKPLPSLDSPWYSWWEFNPDQSTNNNKSIVITSSDNDLSTPQGLSVTWGPESEYRHDYPPLPTGVPSFLYRKPNTYGKIKVEYHKNLPMANLTCVIQNKVGIIKKSFRIMNAVIEFAVVPTSTRALLGTTVVLNCSPKPNHLNTTTTWKHGQTIVPLYRPGISKSIYRFTNGTLVIRNISRDDPFEFLCLITSTSTTFVRSKLVKVSWQVPARITTWSGDIDVVKGTNYNLTCYVYGDSENLMIKWLREESRGWTEKMNVLRSDPDNNKLSRLSLQLLDVTKDDAGQYKCEAGNVFNTEVVEEIVRLTVVDVPGPVSMRGELIPYPRNLSLSWQVPTYNGNKPIINYSVILRSGEEEIGYNVTGTEKIIDNLRPNRVYQVSIRARNAVGLGEECTFKYTTEEAEPDGPVVNLLARANSSTSLVVTWAPPDIRHQNGRILHYQVCHRRLTRIEFSSPTTESQDWSISANNPGKPSDNYFVNCKLIKETYLTLIDLLKFTGYAFRVIAVNVKGTGPGAYTNESTWEDFPDKAPEAITCQGRTTTILVQWNPPPQDSINGILLKYTVRYFQVDNQGKERHKSVDNNVSRTRVTLDSLVPYSNYTIQVAAENKKGSGPMSVPKLCATAQGAPSRPEKVKVVWINGTSALVVWTPPLSPNGLVSYYCINVTNVKRDSYCFKAEQTRQMYLKRHIHNLKINERHKFMVYAYTNQAGPMTLNDPYDAVVDQNRIVSIPLDISVSDGATNVVLDCETINIMTSPITWFHYPKVQSIATEISQRDDRYRIVGNGSLIIRKVNYSMNGVFECRISSSESIKYSLLVTVVMDGIPERPEIYYHSPFLDSVALSWRFIVSSSPLISIAHFSIAVESSEKSVTKQLVRSFNVSSTERSFTVTGLYCGARYKLSLYSVNSAGYSPPGILSFRTLGTRPMWADSSGLLVATYPRAMCFNLSAFLAGEGCAPDKYRISLSPTSSSDLDYATTHTDIDQSQIHQPCNNVTNLNANTGYYYKVAAINSAGSIITTGYNTTLHLSLTNPSVDRSHISVLPTIFKEVIFYVVIFVAFVIFVIPLGLVGYCVRRNYLHKIQTRTTTQTTAPPPIVISSPIITNPAPTRKYLKLPETPQHPYDSGENVPNINEVDEELQPYSTYIQSQTSESNTRISRDKNAYQYPNIAVTGSQQPSTSASLQRTGIESYDNSLKQPLLPTRTLYHKGYSVGIDSRGPMLYPGQLDSSCQEQYRASDSIMSGATGSSTKELAQVFQRNYNLDLPMSLHEQMEEDSSTLRQMDRIAYFESGSSGDDPGIQMFTQERCPGQQAIEPRFTHPTLLLGHQSGLGASTSEPRSSQMLASQVPFSGPSRFTMQATVTEEDESNNYQNNFVIV